MALPDLIARLEQEAQSRVDAIQRNADAEVRAIEDDTEQTVRELTARQLERGRAERHIAVERERAFARRQARGRELEALHAQLRRIVTRARAVIPEAAASPRYIAVLPSHLEQALRFVEGLHPRVRCQPAYVHVLAPVIARSGAELVADDSIGPGVFVEAGDGSVVVDNTLAARLARGERDLIIELARKLRDATMPVSSPN
jgi:vacuolar-type H+-ATPase subunit E/Vma4